MAQLVEQCVSGTNVGGLIPKHLNVIFHLFCWGVNVLMVEQSNVGWAQWQQYNSRSWADSQESQSQQRVRGYWSEMFLEHWMSRPMASERAEVTDFSSLHIRPTLTWQYRPLLYVNFTALFANDRSKDTRVIVEWFVYLPWIHFTWRVHRTVSVPLITFVVYPSIDNKFFTFLLYYFILFIFF